MNLGVFQEVSGQDLETECGSQGKEGCLLQPLDSWRCKHRSSPPERQGRAVVEGTWHLMRRKSVSHYIKWLHIIIIKIDMELEIADPWTSLAVQWLRISASNARGGQ